MSPEAFVELLAKELQVAGVVVGSNYRFGYRAAGTTELLQQLGPQHRMRVQVLGLVAHAQQGSAETGGAPQQQQQPDEQREQQQEQQLGERRAAGMQQAARSTQEQQQQQWQWQHTPEQRAADRQAAHEAVSSSRVRRALTIGDMADAALCLDRPYRLVASLTEGPATSALPDGLALRLPAAALLNQPPRPGSYPVLAAVAGEETLHEVVPARQVVLGVDKAGLTVHGCGDMLAALPLGAAHLTLDFL